MILNSKGLQALKHFFEATTFKKEKPSSETFLRLSELVVTLNCFSFRDNYHKVNKSMVL